MYRLLCCNAILVANRVSYVVNETKMNKFGLLYFLICTYVPQYDRDCYYFTGDV